MTDTSAKTPDAGNELDFPVFTPEMRASLMRQTEAEFMQAFDAFIEAEQDKLLDKRIAAEIAADDRFNAAYRAAKDRAQQ
jgi:hypothetical protein